MASLKKYWNLSAIFFLGFSNISLLANSHSNCSSWMWNAKPRAKTMSLSMFLQYRVLADKAIDAFYKLSNASSQIKTYVIHAKLNLDEALEPKNEIAKAVEEELTKVMSDYGYEIVRTMIVDIKPDYSVEQARNEIRYGIARQHQAIVDGLRHSELGFSENVQGTTAKDVMDMVLVTRYFDAMNGIGAASKSSAIQRLWYNL